MIIDIDIGNTRVKWRFTGEPCALHFNVSDSLPEQWKNLPKGSRFRVSSVVSPDETRKFIDRLASLGDRIVNIAVVKSSFAGVTVAYKDVSCFGVDRWLALLAARVRQPVSDCVVIHAGTALVADFLRADGRHLGGYIIGGWQASLRSLGDAAQALKLSADDVVNTRRAHPGATTLECVEAGTSLLFRGFLRELNRAASECLKSPIWLFAGGDAESMLRLYRELGKVYSAEEFAGCGSEMVPWLVLDGLAIALP